MRKLIVPLTLLAMGLLLGAAVVIDCARLGQNAQGRVVEADAEIAKYEARLVKQLEGDPKASPEVKAAVEKWKSSHDRQERIAAYDSLVAAFRNSASQKIDPNNQLDRKFMDEATGAMNRRDVAQKDYDKERAAYDSFMNGWRGKVAAAVAPSIRRDADK